MLRGIPAIEPKNVIIGQYGKSLDGSKPGYIDDDTVPKDSRCPTFCALAVYIKNERWDGVPFILKAGKALNEQKTEIRIQFKDVTSGIFKDIPRNELVIRVQPNESVYIKMNSKLPGLSMQTAVTELDLTYRRRFSDLKIPEAYEALILDALKGDHSNFVRDDELDASWRIFTPLLHYLDENKEIIPMEYPYGKHRVKEPPPNRLTDVLLQDPVDPQFSTTSPRRTVTNSTILPATSGQCRAQFLTSCRKSAQHTRRTRVSAGPVESLFMVFICNFLSPSDFFLWHFLHFFFFFFFFFIMESGIFRLLLCASGSFI